MYVPSHFALNDPALRRQLVADHPLAMLVGVAQREGASEPWALHVPMRWHERDGQAFLEAHLARANPHCRDLCEGQLLLAVFTVPGAYVSPSLYSGLQNVPTWNYLALEVRGRLVLVDEAADKEDLLKGLIAQLEPDYAAQWAELPVDYQQKMLRAVVGLRLRVEHCEAKAKLSQNRSAEDRVRVQADAAVGAAPDLAQWMQSIAAKALTP